MTESLSEELDRQFDYNLRLVAPGKGEAKRTASQGKIFLTGGFGLATDDILSLYCDLGPVDHGMNATPTGLWALVYDSIFGPAEEVGTSVVNVSPDKLRKFSLLEPRGVYPVSFKSVVWKGAPILRFKMGPRVRGSLALLDNEDLRERFKSEDVLWW